MKWLSSGLAFVHASAACALLLGICFQGLGRGVAICAFVLALAVAVLAYWQTAAIPDGFTVRNSTTSYPRFWLWVLAACFAFVALRSFCWVLYIDGNQLKIQSPNNLGDLGLHLTYIKTFASGVPLWPENPIFAGSYMRYPAGTDLFNALLLLVGVDVIHGLVWAGLLGSVATFYALYRWGGTFGVAGFLFNGGLAGFAFLQTWKALDYQGDKTIAWKSLPLSMLVTQRGLLYALPVGLLLLCHWRAKYFQTRADDDDSGPARGPLPFWLEVTFYATMPLFHVHTFMALSIVAAFFFAIGNSAMRRELLTVVGAAFVPATFFMWTITDHFHASSVLQWKPGWVQTGTGDMAMPFLRFWIFNFGALVPLVLLLIGVCVARAMRSNERFNIRSHRALAFLAPATLIFIFACFVKTAPWEWDNLKLIIWAYLIMLPFLWSELISRWPMPLRAGAIAALFASGIISLYGGLVSNPSGFDFTDRAELDTVGAALRKIPRDGRYAAYPTYNHPLLLQGRRVVMGYPGHLWTQGFDYSETEKKLNSLMRGAPDWRMQARALGARYLFWGRLEKANYASSARPWEKESQLLATGNWGSIYDLEAAPAVTAPSPGQ